MEIIFAVFGAGCFYFVGYSTLVSVGWYAHQWGKVKVSAQLLDLAVLINPRPTQALINRSALRVNHLQDFEGAIRDCNRITEYKTDNGMVYNNRGYAYSRLHQYEEALEDYDTALMLEPENAHARFNRSFLRMKVNGDVDGAIADMVALIDSHPKYLDPYLQLLAYYKEAERVEEAYQLCETAADNFLKPAQVHLLRAYVIQYDKGIEHALPDLDRATELAPKDVTIQFNRGLIFMEAKDFKKAIQAFTVAIERAPKNLNLYINRAICYGRSGDYDNAIADDTHAININPYIAIIYNNRAWVLGKQGNYPQSLQDANHCIKLDRHLSNGWGTRAMTYFLMGEYDKALADFEHSAMLSQRTDPSYSLAGQAVVHYVQDDHNSAQDLWEQVIAEKPKFRDPQEFYDTFYPADDFMNVLHELADDSATKS